jgi:3-hydroxy acid dehydrogenase/malonic semialdehyde reductase
MKTILITGATAGFGLATAETLAAKGHKLLLIARRGEKLTELKRTLKTDVHIATVDVSDRGQVEDFFDSVPDEFKNIDVIVNNAGMALGIDVAQEASLDNWDSMVDVNIKGLMYVTRCGLEVMKKNGSGIIVNVGSIAGHVPYKGGNIYGATKAFVWQFSRGLRTDLFGTGIKVTNLEPAAAATDFASVRFDDEEKGKQFYEGWKPLDAVDIANTIDWIIDQPAHVNIDNIEIMSINQTYAGMAINKD